MHRPFKYIESPIQKLHEHVAEIVGIWCDAAGAFSVELIKDSKLRELVEKIEVRKKTWREVIAEIHDLFREKLTPAERQAILQGFTQNNRIEDLCNKAADPVHYADLPEQVRQPLKDFFIELYTDVLKRKPFEDAYESLKAYFDKLTDASGLTVCPFCALNDLKSRFHDGRDAFDHFLPKGAYPFNSINFRNLAPICHECNSDEKLAKDPLFGGAGKMGRRSATYPFANKVAEVAVTVTFTADLNSIRVASLEPHQFQVNLTCAEVEAAATWDAVFDVRRRYAGKICQKMSEWLQELCKEYRRRKGRMDVEQFFADKLEDFRDSPLASGNFLRYAIFSKLWSDGILAASMREMLANE